MTQPIRMIAGLLAGLLFVGLAIPLSAQPIAHSTRGRGFTPGYNAAQEITFAGTVQSVISKRVIGSPAGLHLLVAGEQGNVDVHVGSLLTRDTRAALHTGLPIQVVGAMQTLHGRQILLARQISFGGRTVTVRSTTGFLIPSRLSESSAHRRAARLNAKGGAR